VGSKRDTDNNADEMFLKGIKFDIQQKWNGLMAAGKQRRWIFKKKELRAFPSLTKVTRHCGTQERFHLARESSMTLLGIGFFMLLTHCSCSFFIYKNFQ
jgi:hypothetical protein